MLFSKTLFRNSVVRVVGIVIFLACSFCMRWDGEDFFYICLLIESTFFYVATSVGILDKRESKI